MQSYKLYCFQTNCLYFYTKANSKSKVTLNTEPCSYSFLKLMSSNGTNRTKSKVLKDLLVCKVYNTYEEVEAELSILEKHGTIK